jgi:hypothetical protein
LLLAAVARAHGSKRLAKEANKTALSGLTDRVMLDRRLTDSLHDF